MPRGLRSTPRYAKICVNGIATDEISSVGVEVEGAHFQGLDHHHQRAYLHTPTCVKLPSAVLVVMGC